MGWATLVEPNAFVLRRRTVRPPGWPPRLDGMRVAVLADLHAGGAYMTPARVRRVATRLARARPDLVLLLGDLVEAHPLVGDGEAPEPVADALAALDAPLGRVAVLGNHDWVQGGWRVRAALERTGVRVLEDEACRVGRGLWVAGVGDAAKRVPDVSAALAAVPPGAPVLLLTHSPDVFPRVPERVALTLAGHTHGGQVDLPVLRPWAVPSRHGDRYARGLIEEDGRLLFVTSGVGTSRYPVRLRRPPEGWLLELRS